MYLLNILLSQHFCRWILTRHFDYLTLQFVPVIHQNINFAVFAFNFVPQLVLNEANSFKERLNKLSCLMLFTVHFEKREQDLLRFDQSIWLGNLVDESELTDDSASLELFHVLCEFAAASAPDD